MNSEDLLREIIRLADIPPHVRMGISWRAIKLENGKTPPWIDNVQPASATCGHGLGSSIGIQTHYGQIIQKTWNHKAPRIDTTIDPLFFVG